MQGFDLLRMVLSIDVLLKIIFLDKVIRVVLVHLIILFFVEQFVLLQVHKAQIRAKLAFFQRVFFIIIAVNVISVKVREDEWYPILDRIEHIVHHLKGYMVEGLLLDFTFALVFS